MNCPHRNTRVKRWKVGAQILSGWECVDCLGRFVVDIDENLAKSESPTGFKCAVCGCDLYDHHGALACNNLDCITHHAK